MAEMQKVEVTFTDESGKEHKGFVSMPKEEKKGLFDKFKKKEASDEKKDEQNKGINWKKVGITAGAVGAGVVAALFGYSKFRKSKSESENYLPPVDDTLALPPVSDSSDAVPTSETETSAS